jgi:phage baseplate assembly protein W
MAFDLKYLNLCDHTVKDRRVIEPDGQYIKLELPVANPSIKVFRNGESVPSDDPIFGWTLEFDQEGSSDFYNEDIPTTTEDVLQKRSVRLKTPTKSLDDFWSVIYITPSDYCRKCGGARVINDWVFNDEGRIDIVENEEKLVQELRKLFLTIQQSHLEHAWYGTNVNDYVGGPIISGLSIRIGAELQEALERFVNIQSKQSVFQDLTPNERVREVVSIDVRQGEGNDSDILFIDITVRTDANTLTEVTFGVNS